MILFPAIDLKDGQCVRLKLGDMAQATVFNDDPAAQALAFERQGFSWLHLVDLNGAFAGQPVNGAAVEAILRAVTIPVQLGGGIRSMAQIESWLAHGIRRVILGTVALRDPQLVREACRSFPGRIVVGIDARGGRVAVEGWAETSDTHRHRTGAAFRRCRRRRHHLHRHRSRWRSEGPQYRLDTGTCRARRPFPSSPAAAWPRSRTCSACCSPTAASSKAPSRAARSMMAGSMRREALALIRNAEAA